MALAELALAVFGFSAAASWTPGPNTMMLAASGANFGFRRSLPHQLGILVGCAALLTLALAGVGAALTARPDLRLVLQICGAAWLLWLAWRIATAAPALDTEAGETAEGETAGETAEGRPLTLVEAAGFQFMNPKAWAVTLGAASTFMDPSLGPEVAGVTIVLVFTLAAAIGCPMWVFFGIGIRRLLHSRRRLRVFNMTMGALLAASVLLILDVPLPW
jgi:threonine/homoserine/homoserine lactone efflux protein